jgi:hypothetical protein
MMGRAGMLRSGNCHPEIISGSLPDLSRLNGFRPGGRNNKAGIQGVGSKQQEARSKWKMQSLSVILNLFQDLLQNRFRTKFAVTKRGTKKCHPEFISGSVPEAISKLTSYFFLLASSSSDVVERING